MKVPCESCGGRLKVVKSAVMLELSADAGLAAAAYLGVLLGPAGLISAVPALWLRKQLFKTAKKSVKGFFECTRCGRTAANKYVLNKLFE